MEEAFETRAEARARERGDGGWRAFDDDETRAFAVDVRREIERSMRAIDDGIAVRAVERETTTTGAAAAAARGERAAARATTRRRTGVAFGTTVRAR